MSDGWLWRWPHASFLLRLASHRARPDPGNLIGIVIVPLALAAFDAWGYLRHVSLAIGLLLVMVATPQAAWVLMRFESAGYVDLVRLSGASPRVAMQALFWSLVAPIFSIGLVFLGSGWVFGAVSSAELVSVLVGFELIATATIVVLIGPRMLQRWAPQLLLTISVGGAMVFAIISAGRANAWNLVEWPSWPLIAAGAAVPMILLLRPLRTVLHHRRQSPASSPTARRIPLIVSFDVAPVFARSLLQSSERALVSLAAAVLGVAVLALFRSRAGADLDVLASVAVYLPLPFALLVIGGESRLDAESDRVQFIRGAPVASWRATAESIAGWCVPFVIASLVIGVLVRIVFGVWPVFQVIAWFAVAMLAPVAAAEGWMVRSPFHLAALACAGPLLLVFNIAARPAIDKILLLAPVAWIPFAAAMAAFRSPQRPAFAPVTTVLALVACCSVVFSQLMLPIRATMRPYGLLLAAGVLVASPLFGSHRTIRLLVAPIIVAGTGAFFMAFQPHPLWPGATTILLVVLCLFIGDHVDHRYSGERVTMMRIMGAYAVVIGGALVPMGLQMAHIETSPVTAALAANGLAMVLIAVLTGIAPFVHPRSDRREITS